jgi:hypothetical protein
MNFDVNLIAPIKSGLSKYYKPFLIGNEAFEELDNCYVRQGTIRKREGSTVFGRLPIWNTVTSITNTTPPVVTTATNHGLQTNDMVYFENVLMTNGAISDITIEAVTAHAIVTVAGAPGVVAGQTVLLVGTSGITQLDGSSINNKVYFVMAVGANTITLNVQIMGTYIAGADFVYLGAITNTAFRITVTAANQFTLQTLNSNPAVDMTASGTATAGNIYLPIVGTRTFIQSNIQGIEQLVVFHPKKAFQFNTATQVFDDISFNQIPIPITWEGTKDDFFYTSNYFGVMWTTNNISVPNRVVDSALQSVGIKYYTGNLTAGWTDFQPPLFANAPITYLNSALLILPHKGFLVTLNTTEGDINNNGNINFYNRARWSQLGTPFYRNVNLPTGAGFDPNAWVTDIPGKGGYTDADTSEKIVSVEIIQDTMIVGFQFSTWRLRFTGNFILPFIWERINTQFGCEATFSTVPFDNQVLMISRRGIVGATFNNVERIDMELPEQIEQFEQSAITSSYPVVRNNNALVRTHGIRDFEKRMVYWIYAEQEENLQTPNKILCFNYIDNTWSTFTQSFTTLGKFTVSVDSTWQTWISPWNGDNSTWSTGVEQQGSLMIVAGDVKSQVWQIMNDAFSNDNGINFDFTITTGWVNPYFQEGKRCKLAYYDLYLTTTDNGEITLENFTNDNDSDPWLIKTVYTNDQALTTNPVKQVKYIRVFLGMVARNHQIRLTMTQNQIDNTLIGSSDFELQGILFHTRKEGRIKN